MSKRVDFSLSVPFLKWILKIVNIPLFYIVPNVEEKESEIRHYLTKFEKVKSQWLLTVLEFPVYTVENCLHSFWIFPRGKMFVTYRNIRHFSPTKIFWGIYQGEENNFNLFIEMLSSRYSKYVQDARILLMKKGWCKLLCTF